MTPFLAKMMGRRYRLEGGGGDSDGGDSGGSGSSTGGDSAAGRTNDRGGYAGESASPSGGFNGAKDSQSANKALGLGPNSTFSGGVSINGTVHSLGGQPKGLVALVQRAKFNAAKDSQEANVSLGLSATDHGTPISVSTYIGAPQQTISFPTTLSLAAAAIGILSGTPMGVIGGLQTVNAVVSRPSDPNDNLGVSGGVTMGAGGMTSNSGPRGSASNSGGGGGVGGDLAGGFVKKPLALIDAVKDAATVSTTDNSTLVTSKPLQLPSEVSTVNPTTQLITTNGVMGAGEPFIDTIVTAIKNNWIPLLAIGSLIYWEKKHG